MKTNCKNISLNVDFVESILQIDMWPSINRTMRIETLKFSIKRKTLILVKCSSRVSNFPQNSWCWIGERTSNELMFDELQTVHCSICVHRNLLFFFWSENYIQISSFIHSFDLLARHLPLKVDWKYRMLLYVHNCRERGSNWQYRCFFLYWFYHIIDAYTRTFSLHDTVCNVQLLRFSW